MSNTKIIVMNMSSRGVYDLIGAFHLEEEGYDPTENLRRHESASQNALVNNPSSFTIIDKDDLPNFLNDNKDILGWTDGEGWVNITTHKSKSEDSTINFAIGWALSNIFPDDDSIITDWSLAYTRATNTQNA